MGAHVAPGVEEAVQITHRQGQISHGSLPKLSGTSSSAAGPRLLGTGVPQSVTSSRSSRHGDLRVENSSRNAGPAREKSPSRARPDGPVATGQPKPRWRDDPFSRVEGPGRMPEGRGVAAQRIGRALCRPMDVHSHGRGGGNGPPGDPRHLSEREALLDTSRRSSRLATRPAGDQT